LALFTRLQDNFKTFECFMKWHWEWRIPDMCCCT